VFVRGDTFPAGNRPANRFHRFAGRHGTIDHSGNPATKYC
jgi:hypothetical protein